MNNFKADLQVVERRKIYFGISFSVATIGLIFMIINLILGGGMLNLGIDFTGGTILNVEVGTGITEENKEEIAQIALDMLNGIPVTGITPLQYTSLGTDQGGFTVRYPIQNFEDSEGNKLTSEQALSRVNDIIMGSLNPEHSLQSQILNYLNKDLPQDEYYTELNVKVLPESVSRTQSSALLISTMLTILLAVVAMLGYISLRFEFSSGISAVVALFHDVIIMVVIVAIFRIPVNTNFIAAVITIVGVSINNTVVVFDRIRENSKKLSLVDFTPAKMVDKSIMETLNRCINTTVTTLFTIVPFAILGGSGVQEFTVPIIIGLLAGTYSSIFIAPSMWALYHEVKHKKNQESDYLKQTGKLKESKETK